MSREDLKGFVKTVEKNIIIKEKLSKCKTINDLISLAKSYGYIISIKDLKYDRTATEIDVWYQKSRLSPLRSWSDSFIYQRNDL